MFKFKFNMKPKINFKKSYKDKELILKSLNTEIKYETDLSEDVILKANIKADLNSQVEMGLDRIKEAEVSFNIFYY